MAEAPESHPGLTAWVKDREHLIALARHVVGSPAVAEEIVQEGWLRWHGRGYSADDVRPLLRRIVVNLARDWRRRREVETAVVAEQALHSRYAFDSERIVAARQDLACITEELAQMPRRTVRALWLHRIEGRTYAEIAAQLGVAQSTAYRLIEDALVQLILVLDG
ncbi:MAG: RNA polymerase sigma factor [Pseudomonadota bacterium]